MKNTTRIGVVLVISVAFFIAEIAGVCVSYERLNQADTVTLFIVGFRTKSLALIADAVRGSHLCSNVSTNSTALVLVLTVSLSQCTWPRACA